MADWTTPKTWAYKEALSSTDMNTYVKNNLSHIYNAITTWTAWVPTFTGFSSIPSGYTSRYIQFGKFVFWKFYPGSDGTSNATTFTMTLPITSGASAIIRHLCQVTNSGTSQADAGLLYIGNNGTTCAIYRTLAGGGFTASGGKNVAFSIWYETA